MNVVHAESCKVAGGGGVRKIGEEEERGGDSSYFTHRIVVNYEVRFV